MNVIYKIEWSWSYIGETGRMLETRKKEHIRNVTNYTPGSNVASHAWNNRHKIGFDKGNYRTRKFEMTLTTILSHYQNNT